MAISDDWSYIRTAQVLAQTGHIAYNGWATALVGWQFYLGAASIKLFGFSFTATRLPTFLIALVTAYLMQRTLVRLGISEGNAVIGTLTFVLSPLFMMLSVTMMTDVPGFFSILACLYCCVRALQSKREREAIGSLCFAVAINAICGTSRQIAWLGVLVIVPCTLWLLRSRRRVMVCGWAATVFGWLFVVGTMHWYAHQPYAVQEGFSLPAFTKSNLAMVVTAYDRSLLNVSLLTLPVGALYIAEIRRWKPRSYMFALEVAVCTGMIFYCILRINPRNFGLEFLLNPFLGDWVGIHGSYDGFIYNFAPPPVLSPVLFGHALRVLLTFLASASLLCMIVAWATRRSELPNVPTEPLTRHQLFWLLGPFTGAYMLLLLERASGILFDRYMLGPMFVLLFVSMRFYQRRIRSILPAASVFMLSMLAVWGIICVHNMFALYRAHVALGQEVLDTGIPPFAVDFGWEQNGWVELQSHPAVNDKRIINPRSSYIHIEDPLLPYCYGQSIYFGNYPHLAPRYGISFEPNACAGAAPFTPVAYTSWPDLRRAPLYVVKYPPPWRPLSDYAVPTTGTAGR
jgi:hypothetical protein